MGIISYFCLVSVKLLLPSIFLQDDNFLILPEKWKSLKWSSNNFIIEWKHEEKKMLWHLLRPLAVNNNGSVRFPWKAGKFPRRMLWTGSRRRSLQEARQLWVQLSSQLCLVGHPGLASPFSWPGSWLHCSFYSLITSLLMALGPLRPLSLVKTLQRQLPAPN